MLRFLRGAIDASLASLNGDAVESLRIIDSLPFGQVPAAVSEIVTRLRVTMLMLTGRADDAVTAAARLADSADPHVRDRPAHVRWQAGDPWEFAVRPPSLDDSASINDRDRFMYAAEVAAVCSSLGDRDGARAAIEKVVHYDGRHSDARHSAITACAIACRRVLEHDETAARQAIDAHLDAHPIDDRLGTLHLGRHLAVGYVLVPGLRQHWDAAPLGPHHVRVREAARRFLDARRGELDSGTVLPDPGLVVTALPHPWSVELAVQACRSGASDGRALLSTSDRVLARRNPIGARMARHPRRAPARTRGGPPAGGTADGVGAGAPGRRARTPPVDDRRLRRRTPRAAARQGPHIAGPARGARPAAAGSAHRHRVARLRHRPRPTEPAHHAHAPAPPGRARAFGVDVRNTPSLRRRADLTRPPALRRCRPLAVPPSRRAERRARQNVRSRRPRRARRTRWRSGVANPSRILRR